MVSAEVVERLRLVSREHRATLFMTLLAGFKALLTRQCNARDVVVGVPVAGRTHSELEELIGFFVNTLALRTDCSGDPTFGELVGRVREVALGAYAHQDVPFEQLVDELNLPRDLSRNPLVQVIFQLMQFSGPRSLEGAGLRAAPFGPPAATARLDLEVYLQEEDGGLVGSVVYSTDVFDEATIERLVDQFVRVLSEVANHPGIGCRNWTLWEKQSVTEWWSSGTKLPRPSPTKPRSKSSSRVRCAAFPTPPRWCSRIVT